MQTVLVVLASLVVMWGAFVAFVWLARPSDVALGDAVRLLPDTLRLVRRLAGDPTVPRRTRWLLVLLLIYLASPIDLVPDFIPVIGYADDAIVTTFVLRRVIAQAGRSTVDRHWPGTAEGLTTLLRLLRLQRVPTD